MRGAMVVAVMLATGCGSFYQHKTTRSMQLDTGDTWKHEVDYELLGQVTGQACASDYADLASKGSSRDPAANGPPALFEQAKYAALATAKDVDGMVAVRSMVTITNAVVCVSVIGRAYRVTKLRATAGVAMGESPKAKPNAATDMLPMRD